MSTLTASTEHKPILAERFKTKVCRTFAETGSCPYEARCMFAHGAADLRSKEMNIKDGLVTEEAIRVFLVARLTAARQVVDSNGEVRTSILAERFKTKMCQNYERRGACPYEARCMFAHGDHDLRTPAQNTEDGLTSEDAIRAFQRTGKLPAKPAAKTTTAALAAIVKGPVRVRSESPKVVAAQATPMPSPAASVQSLASLGESFADSTPVSRAAVSLVSVTPVKGRRHNPYAPVVFGPAEGLLSFAEANSRLFARSLSPAPCACAACAGFEGELSVSPLAAVMTAAPRSKLADLSAPAASHAVLLA